MYYNYLIWGNWSPIYLAVIFLVIVLIYILVKDKLSLENFSDKKLKIFFIAIIAFFIYQIVIYNPKIYFFRDLFLMPINKTPNLAFNVNILPFAHLIVFVAVCLILIYGYKYLEKAFPKINIFKKSS